jgi:acid phosphatase class B
MKPEKIMFDIDDTLFINDAVLKMAKKHNVNLDDYKVTYNLTDCGLPKQMVDDIFNLFYDKEFMGNLEPMPYSHYIIDYLNHYGHIVECVTARNENVSDATHDMIWNEFLGKIKSIKFLGNESKINYIKERGYTVIVEDKAETLLELANDMKEKAPLMFLVSTPKSVYNHKYIDECKSKGIIVIHNLKEIKKFIKSLTI